MFNRHVIFAFNRGWWVMSDEVDLSLLGCSSRRFVVRLVVFKKREKGERGACLFACVLLDLALFFDCVESIIMMWISKSFPDHHHCCATMVGHMCVFACRHRLLDVLVFVVAYRHVLVW